MTVGLGEKVATLLDGEIFGLFFSLASVAKDEPAEDEFIKIFFLTGLAFGEGEFGNQDAPQLQIYIATLGDALGVADSFGKIFAPTGDNIFGLDDIELEFSETHTVGVGKIGGSADTEEDFVSFFVFFANIVGITGNN